MTVEYRDETEFTGDNHTSTELANAIRTKKYGKDVREPIAQLADKLDSAIKGQNIGSVVATPTKVFANLSALQSAYPNGADGVMVTVNDGHKHFWQDNSWVDGGVYQAFSKGNQASSFFDFSHEEQRIDLNTLGDSAEIYSFYLPIENVDFSYENYNFPIFSGNQATAVAILETYDLATNNDLIQRLTLQPGDTYVRYRIGTQWFNWEPVRNPTINSSRFHGYSNGYVSIRSSEIENDEIMYFDGSDAQKSDGWPREAYGAGYVTVKNVKNSTLAKRIIEIKILSNYNNIFWGFVKPDNTTVWISGVESMPEKYGQVSHQDFDANSLFNNFLFIVDGTSDQNKSINLPVDLSTENGGFAYMHVYHHGDNNYLQEITTGSGKWIRQHNVLGWGQWKNITPQDSAKSYAHALDAPQKFAVIGDSLTVGMAGDSNQNRNEWYSWPQYIARKAGNTAVNLGTTGDTVLTWWDSHADHGRNKALLPENKAQLYVIELSRNDALQKLTIGSTSDIVHTSNADNVTTFYGGYSRILSLIHEINPQAVVVAVTDPGVQNADGDACAKAISDITKDAFFKDWVLLVDLHNDPQAVKEYQAINAGMTYSTGGGHANQVGYTGYAEFYNRKIAEYWPNSNFREVDFSKIPY